MIDLDLIGRGKDYIELDESFIIFICMKNPFEMKSRHKYSFENICAEDTAIRLEDKAHKIFVTPDSNADDVSEELSAFLNYLATKIPTSELTKRIEWEVDKARRHDEWRMQYMTLDMRDKEKKEEGRLAERLNAVVKLLTKGYDKDFIKSLDYTDEEIANAEKVLLTDKA